MKFIKTLLLGTFLSVLLTSCVSVNSLVLKDDSFIYFYSLTCPHCKNVKEFLDKNQVLDKLPIEEKEVSENRTNATLLTQAAVKCQIDQNEIGVPFLFDQGKCVVGDTPIIEHLTLKLNELTTIEATPSAQPDL